MKLIDKINNYLQSLEEKKFKQYAYIFILLVIIAAGFFIYRYNSKLKSLKLELQKVNRAREEGQILLSKDLEIKKQKAKVDRILEKGKGFKIIQYFDSVTNKLELSNKIKEKIVSTNELENLRTEGYMEVKLETNLENINSKDLVELLKEIEQNERIYTKYLSIEKTDSQTINVNLIIATLQKIEEAEAME